MRKSAWFLISETPANKILAFVNICNNRAWQKTVCKTYQVYLEATKTRRIELHQITATIRGNAYKEKEISRANNINDGI